VTTVFVAGSIAIKKLHPLFRDRLSNIVQSKFDIVLGDADGADSSIQKALFDLGAEKVTVYCAGLTPRNNLGSWPVQNITSDAEPGTREFYTAKDIKMAAAADYGLMVWDTKSTGTLSNVLELLRLGRKSVVFINKDKRFINVCSVDDLDDLISAMSDTAKLKAEDKIRLSKKVASLKSPQFHLA
jgi:hypothetical protein